MNAKAACPRLHTGHISNGAESRHALFKWLCDGMGAFLWFLQGISGTM
jgi:hypothetical protein